MVKKPLAVVMKKKMMGVTDFPGVSMSKVLNIDLKVCV